MNIEERLAALRARTQETMAMVATAAAGDDGMSKAATIEEHHLQQVYERARAGGMSHAQARAELDKDDVVAECADAADAIRKAAARATNPDQVKRATTSAELLRKRGIGVLEFQKSGPHFAKLAEKIAAAQTEGQPNAGDEE